MKQFTVLTSSKRPYLKKLKTTRSFYSGWESCTGPTENAILNPSGSVSTPLIPFPEERHIFFPRKVEVLNILQSRQTDTLQAGYSSYPKCEAPDSECQKITIFRLSYNLLECLQLRCRYRPALLIILYLHYDFRHE